MIFGDYNQGRVFKIENSQMHKEAGSRVRSVEFILLKGKNGLWFIEAKSSRPKYQAQSILKECINFSVISPINS